MRVFLTGATGFIGSHLTKLLVREGCEVYAVVREDSTLWRIEEVIPHLNLVHGDMLDLDKLGLQIEMIKPDLGLHLAWYAVPGKYLTANENLGMLNASLELASHLASVGCKRFVGIGTCFEYDTGFGYLSEASPTKPQSLYAASKLALQIVLEQLGRETGMAIAWARLFYQYGPFEDERRLMPSIICSLLRNQEVKVTKGEQIRDFLHVEDVSEALWAVARSDLTGPVNIGSGNPVAVRDIVEKIGAILDRSDLIALGALPYRDSDPMFVCANNQLLLENTTWAPRYSLEQGLRHAIDWWRLNRGPN